MRCAFRSFALIFIAGLAGTGTFTQGQEKPKHSLPEIKTAPPGYEDFRRQWSRIQHNKDIRRLTGEVALRKGYLERLEKRHKQLLDNIKTKKRLIELINKGLFGAKTELYWDKSSMLPWPKARYPLILHDYIEKWLPEYERAQLRRMEASGKKTLDYSLYDVWRWAIPREEAALKNMEEELAKLPEQIREARRSLSKAERELNTRIDSLAEKSGDAASGGKKDIIDAGGTGELFGKPITYAQLEGCGNGDPKFTMTFPPALMERGLGEQSYEYMGLSMPCASFAGGRRVEFQEACNRFSGARPPMTARVLPWGVPVCWPNSRKWRPPKRGEAGWGLNGKPLSSVCYEAHFGRPATPEEQRDIIPLLKFTVRSLHVECFYIKRATLERLVANR